MMEKVLFLLKKTFLGVFRIFASSQEAESRENCKGDYQLPLGKLTKLSLKKMDQHFKMETPTSTSRKRKLVSPDDVTTDLENPWMEFYRNNLQKSKQDDFVVAYYVTGQNLTQADRDYVAQVMCFYLRRTKRDSCPNSAAVTPLLPGDVQGLTTNRAANNAFELVFKTPKHINAMYKYLSDTRAQHNDIVVHFSVDGSPFFAVK